MNKKIVPDPAAFFDDRPIDESDDELFCDPLNDGNVQQYFSKIKEKKRYQEKNQENDRFFG